PRDALSVLCTRGGTSYVPFYVPAPRLHLHSFPTRRSSDLRQQAAGILRGVGHLVLQRVRRVAGEAEQPRLLRPQLRQPADDGAGDRKSTRLNSSHSQISYAVFCLKKKKTILDRNTYHRQSI